jgi:DNA-binding XRE family transcriptional regulator
MLGMGRLHVDTALIAGAKEEIPVGHTSVLHRSRSNTGPFIPEPIAPEDYLPARAATEVSGERQLLLAILESAIDDIQKYGRWRERAAGKLAREALEWIESPDTAPYSFEHACDVLGLDASYLRAGVRHGLQPAAALAPPPPAPATTWPGHRVRALRDRLDWSQQRLGRACGVAQSTIGHWEADASPPPPAMIVMLEHLEAAQ